MHNNRCVRICKYFFDIYDKRIYFQKEKNRKFNQLMRYCGKRRRIYTHWGQTPLLLWETFGRFLFFGLKFEKSLYNLNAMEKVFIRF